MNGNRIEDYCRTIVEEPLKQLLEAGFWVEEESWRMSHLFGIRHQTMPIEKIKSAFAEKNIFVSFRGSAIRVAPYVHNTVDDLNVMTEVLLECIKQHA